MNGRSISGAGDGPSLQIDRTIVADAVVLRCPGGRQGMARD